MPYFYTLHRTNELINFELYYKNIIELTKLFNKFGVEFYFISTIRSRENDIETNMINHKLYILKSDLEQFLYGTTKFNNKIIELKSYYFDDTDIIYYEVGKTCNKILLELNTHPMHLIIKKILLPTTSINILLKSFINKLEILLLSRIYDHYNNIYKILCKSQLNYPHYQIILIDYSYHNKEIIIEIGTDDDKIIENKILINTTNTDLNLLCVENKLDEFMKPYLDKIDILLKDNNFIDVITFNKNTDTYMKENGKIIEEVKNNLNNKTNTIVELQKQLLDQKYNTSYRDYLYNEIIKLTKMKIRSEFKNEMIKSLKTRINKI